MMLKTALRMALLRVGGSDTSLCPSQIFRDIEAGSLTLAEAADAFTDLLTDFGDKRWATGVEGTVKCLDHNRMNILPVLCGVGGSDGNV